jgi:hypothetical protein
MMADTLLETTKQALHDFVLTTPSILAMAMASEALRLLNEREDEAVSLFSNDAADEPPTDKQLRYLRIMGYRGPVCSRADASMRIQDMKGRRTR